jgi:lactate dehydrogenase-like 2-hydroxyacid dehydrogenase
MSKDIMLLSSVPTFMMNDLQQEYVLHDHAHILDPEAFTKVTAFVGVGSSARVDRNLLAMFPNVKMISIFGVGYDGIDVAAVQDRGIQVTHTPDVLTDDVADLAMGLILSMGRRIPQSDKFVRNGDWVSEPFTMTHKVTGTRLGVVGLGRIGQAITKRAAAFDMTIAYTGRRAKTNAPFRYYPSATELAANSDYLVVAVPGGDDTKNMINAQVLKALGPKGIVVNIARGSVIDQTALIQALKDKSIAGAGLDVFWDEPNIDPQFFKLHNVVLTPHNGSNTHETRRAMADLALANLKAFFDERPLLTLIPECQ